MAATAEQLSQFLQWLRSAGELEAGDQQYLAAYELLEMIAEAGRWPDEVFSWKTLIAPILCSSPADQGRFQTLFDSWFETTPASKNVDAPHPSDELAKSGAFSWERVIVALAVMILGVSVWAWHRFGPHHGPPPPRDNGQNTNAELFQDASRVSQFAVEVKSSNGEALPHAEVDYAGEQEFTSDSGSVLLKTPGARERRWLLVRDDKYTVWVQQLSEDLPPKITVQLAPVRPRSNGWGEKYLEYLRRSHPFILILPLSALTAYLIWLRLRALELRKWTTPIEPRLRHIGLQQSSRVFRGSDIHKLAIGLRRRRALYSSDIDAELTAESTAKMAGWFTPVTAKSGIEPEYLVLEERKNLRDHRPRSHDELISRLHDHDVAIRRYYFQSDPRVCSDSSGHTFSLGDLAAIYPTHELWLTLDADKCVDPLSGRPEKWVTHLSNWNHRVLLSWAAPRVDLNTRFTTPTRRGLQSLVSDTPEQAQPSGPFPSLLGEEPERWLERNAPPDAVQMRLLVQLQRYLGPRRYVCLQACAVYPAIAWNITTTLVDQLLRSEEVEDALDLLVRLPWLRYGAMPDWLRRRLVATLGSQETVVRNALKTYLEVSSEQLRGKEVLDIVPAGRTGTKHLNKVDDYIYLSFVTRRSLENLSVRSPSRWRRLLLYSFAIRAAAAIVIAALLIAGLQLGSSRLIHWIKARQFLDAKPTVRPQEPFVAEMLDVANGLPPGPGLSATEGLRKYSEVASDVMDRTNPLAPLLRDGPITRDQVARIPGATIVPPSTPERGMIWARANEVGIVDDADASSFRSANSSNRNPISSVSFFIKLSNLPLERRVSAASGEKGGMLSRDQTVETANPTRSALAQPQFNNSGEPTGLSEDQIRQRLAHDERLGNQVLAAKDLGDLAVSLMSAGKEVEAEQIFRRALAINEAIGNQVGMVGNLEGLGLILHDDKGDYARAEQIFQEALGINEKLSNQVGMARDLEYLGMTLRDKGDYARAEQIFQEALGINEKMKDEAAAAIVRDDIARLSQLKGGLPVAKSSIPQAAAPSASANFTQQNPAQPSPYDRGKSAYDQQQYVQALMLFSEACNGGEMRACNYLGYLYAQGLGVPRDTEKARTIYQRACTQANLTSCASLGSLYQGSGDVIEARNYFKRACDGGLVQGCRLLSGLDTPQVSDAGQQARQATNAQPHNTRPTANANRLANSAPSPPSGLSASVDAVPNPPTNLSASVARADSPATTRAQNSSNVSSLPSQKSLTLVRQSDWIPRRGSWNVSDGTAIQTDENVQPGVAVLVGSEDATELTCEARRLSGKDGFSVIVSYDSDNLAAWWDIGGYGGQKSIAEFSTPDKGVYYVPQTDKPFLIETGRWYSIRIQRAGSHVWGTVDNALLLDYFIPDSIGGKGKFGFRTWSSQMEFRNVSMSSVGFR